MLPALVAGMLLAASPTYEVSLRSEVRASTDGEGDGQLNPALSLNFPLGHFSLSGAYTPRLLLFEPGASKKISVYHAGHLNAAQRFSRATRLFVDQQASYGENSFSFLVTGADITQPLFDRLSFDRLAQLPPFLYFSETTTLGLDQALSRKVLLSATASYMVSGGADAAGRALAPLMRIPRLRVILASQLGTRDFLIGTLDASSDAFSSSQRSYAVDLGVGWRHLFSKYSDFDVAVGVAGGRNETAEVVENRVYPYVAAGIRRQFVPGARDVLTGSLGVRLAPAFDPLTGRVYERADTLGSLVYSPIVQLKFTAVAGGSIALSGPLRGQKLGFGGLGIWYEVNRHLSLNTGMRVVALPNVLAVGFFAITLSDSGHF